VPTEFQYVTEHAEAPLQLQNAIWVFTNQGLWSVADQEGWRGVAVHHGAGPARSPRIPSIATKTASRDTGLDSQTIQYALFKYPDAKRIGAGGRRHRGPAHRGRGGPPETETSAA